MGFAAYGKVTGLQGFFPGWFSLRNCHGKLGLCIYMSSGRQPRLMRPKHSETGGVLDRRMAMAQVIEFYVPDRFRKKVRWVPPEQRGKVIAFPLEVKKSA